MTDSIHNQIQEATITLRAMVSHAQEVLEGRGTFNIDILRAITAPLQQMAPLVSQADQLGAASFKEYGHCLNALNTALERIRFMLLARQNSLQTSRSHLETVDLWATRLNQTR